MKNILFIILSIISLNFSAQVYPSMNISLVGMLNPNTGSVGVGSDNRRYNSCWGYKHPGNNKEFAIVGASHGTYFIDISSPATPSVSAFVPGRLNCTWREIKTYQNYCYVVSDDGAPNTFQIIDMTQLPSTVTVVHNSNSIFERGHTIYIDGINMYVGSSTYSNATFSSMDVYSLATPSAPLLMRRLNQDFPAITHVHDMFVKNDTVFASCGNQGLNLYEYKPSLQQFIQLGSYTNYAGAPYNHSSWKTDNGKYLVFCDEVPAALPIRLVDIQNFSNIQPISTFQPHPNTTPHNPYVVGNNYAYVACYQDGLNLYNIANPTTPYLAGYFDTHPQGGFNINNYGGPGLDYRGNWGAYPYLPSGIIIATDMQNGMFLLDPAQAFVFTGTKSNFAENSDLNFYPNPANDQIAINYNTKNKSLIQIKNMLGQLVYEKNVDGKVNEYIDLRNLNDGAYLITIEEENRVITKKLIVNH